MLKKRDEKRRKMYDFSSAPKTLKSRIKYSMATYIWIHIWILCMEQPDSCILFEILAGE